MVVVPHRVPWSTPEEFHQVFGWLFAADGDLVAQWYAIDRIKVWLNRGGCPHAIESTASLLELILRDAEAQQPSTSTSTLSIRRPSQQELRLAYSMAMIRFVNSLVDPLQTTYFARSIAALANQLGLPIWFVELRHAATHEDLPGLGVLRDAARQALDWLYTNYWLPTIQPSSSSSINPTNAAVPFLSLDPLRTLLSTYKSLMKVGLRDASKATQIRPELKQNFKSIEAWVQEVERLGRSKDSAVESLVEVLLETGSLVPAAKKKRVSARSPELSVEQVAIWTPLLDRLDDTFDGFQETLLGRIVEVLGASSKTEATASSDRSCLLTLSAWVLELIREVDDLPLLESTLKSLLINSNPITLTLVDQLSNTSTELADLVRPLVNVMRNSELSFGSGGGSAGTGLEMIDDPTEANRMQEDQVEDQLELMERRMQELEQRMKENLPLRRIRSPSAQTGVQGDEDGVEKVGWQIVPNWKPCPIGLLPGQKGVLSLDLPCQPVMI